MSKNFLLVVSTSSPSLLVFRSTLKYIIAVWRRKWERLALEKWEYTLSMCCSCPWTRCDLLSLCLLFCWWFHLSSCHIGCYPMWCWPPYHFFHVPVVCDFQEDDYLLPFSNPKDVNAAYEDLQSEFRELCCTFPLFRCGLNSLGVGRTDHPTTTLII